MSKIKSQKKIDEMLFKASELYEFIKKNYRFLNLEDQKEAKKLIDSAKNYFKNANQNGQATGNG